MSHRLIFLHFYNSLLKGRKSGNYSNQNVWKSDNYTESSIDCKTRTKMSKINFWLNEDQRFFLDYRTKTTLAYSIQRRVLESLQKA